MSVKKFSDTIKDSLEDSKNRNYLKFAKKRPNIIDMIGEIKERLPWKVGIINSMLSNIRMRGKLSEKQEKLITSIYIDCLATTEEKLKEQVAARKLLFRLNEIGSSRQTKNFIASLIHNSDSWSLTPNQIKAIQKLAERYRLQLEKIPLPAGFDGWFISLNIDDNGKLLCATCGSTMVEMSEGMWHCDDEECQNIDIVMWRGSDEVSS